jgi:polar amino acid transport system substrate-binding protein
MIGDRVNDQSACALATIPPAAARLLLSWRPPHFTGWRRARFQPPRTKHPTFLASSIQPQTEELNMKSTTTLRYAALAAGMTLLTMGAAEAKPSFAASGTVAVCTDATFPPMEYFEKSGDKDPVGFDIDLVNALAENLGVKAKFVVTDFSGLLPSLEAKRCDLVVSGIFVTEERQKKFDAIPYLGTSTVLVAKAGTAQIGAPEELSGKVVAVQTGTSFVELFQKINKGIEDKKGTPIDVQLYPKASDGIQQVLIGRAIATTTQDTEVAYRNLQNPGQLEAIYTFPDQQTFGIFARREGDDKKELEAAMAALKANGKLAEIVKKWNLSEEALK